ncbi:Calcineurin-like phosphoesterase superfamily domain protein [compost metagenome]
MRIAFINDSSGNLPALSTILSHMEEQEIDSKVHLGNIIGMCPFPDECLRLTIEKFNYFIKGKFENALLSGPLGLIKSEKDGYEKTVSLMEKESLEYIENMQDMVTLPNQLLFAHAGPFSSIKSLRTEQDINLIFGSIGGFDLAFVGQSYATNEIWHKDNSGIRYQKVTSKEESTTIKLDSNHKYIVGVGSSGTPRNNDPRTGYVIYDTDTNSLTFIRLSYSIDRTIGKMQRLGYSTDQCIRVLNGR